MAGLFSRVKVWNEGETVNADDLNAEFNNILANVDATHSEGYSQNLSQMQSTEDPGAVGTENLTQPISETDEIKRIRFVLQRLMGTSEWYQAPSATIATLNSSISQAFFISPNRIISGAKSAVSSQPKFLEALSSGGVKLLATATPLNLFINGVLYTISTDISLTGLTAALGSSNTATLADTFSNAQYSKGVQTFNISGAGTAFTGQIGNFAAFKIVNGGNTEYFVGTVASATQLTGLRRGFCFDATNTAIAPITLTTGHTITILKMSYIFVTTAGTMAVTYNPLRYGKTNPAGAVIGDYWYDETNSTWKTYNGITWVVANATLIGFCAQDSTGATVLARSEDIYQPFRLV